MLNYVVKDVELELSTLCQAECPLCYRNYNTFTEHYPENLVRPLDEVVAQLNGYTELEYVRLVGSISEPTLYPYFIELVKYIKSRKIKIEICTNGSTRTTKWWRELAAEMNNEDSVYFSICGSTQELHNIYRTNTSLEKILKNAQAFREVLAVDYAQLIRFNYNDKNFDSQEMAEMLKPFTNIYWTETFLLKDSSNYKNKLNLNKLKPFQGKVKEYELVEKIATLKFDKGLSKEANCKAFNENRLQVDISGKEWPCYLTLEAQIDPDWTWEEILSMKYNACKFCEKSIVKMCDDKDLDYII